MVCLRGVMRGESGKVEGSCWEREREIEGEDGEEEDEEEEVLQ